MQKFLIVGFMFCKNLYHSIVMVKKKSDCTIYQITVMNGDLEKLLYGNHRICEINGCLHVEPCENKEQEILKVNIAEALSKLLRIPLKRALKLRPQVGN